MSLRPGLSRRATLGGVGLGAALGLASLHTAFAQDTEMVSLATHPIVGAWNTAFGAPNSGTLAVYAVFHPDGTLTLLHPFAGPGIGVWSATGERTGETTLKFQNIAVAPGEMLPGTVTVWESFTVSEDDSTYTTEVVVELRALDGTVVALFPDKSSGARRLTVESPPPVDTTGSATPST